MFSVEIPEKKAPRTLIALATYNERENLPSLVEAVFEAMPQCELLVVDDASPDGTGDWVGERMQNENRLKLLRRTGKDGLGTAVLAAMRYAVDHDYELFLNMDADWSHSPESIPKLVQAIAPDCDVAIGSRYVRGGKIEGWPLYRKMMSRCINFYARWMLGLRTLDNSGSFRCYKVEALKKLDFEAVRSRGYSFFEEILFWLRRSGARFREIPITFTERRFGCSKINKKEAWIALKTIAMLRFRPPSR